MLECRDDLHPPENTGPICQEVFEAGIEGDGAGESAYVLRHVVQLCRAVSTYLHGGRNSVVA